MQCQYQYTMASPQHKEQLIEFNMKLVEETEPNPLQRSLVENAVAHILENPECGRFYIAVEQEDISLLRGEIFVAYLSPVLWMIQSVYVHKDHRNKGLFRNLFNSIKANAKQQGVQQIRLYAIKTNEKAKNTYEKMGFNMTDEEFYTTDFVYGSQLQIQRMQKKISENITSMKPHNEISNQLKNIFGKSGTNNKTLYCIRDNEISGICEYIEQFAIWRNKTAIYILYLQVCAQNALEITYSFKKYLYDTLDIGTIRYICPRDQLHQLKTVDPFMREDHHNNFVLSFEASQ